MEPLDQVIQEVLLFIPKLIVALMAFGATLVLSGIAARWSRRVAGKKIDDPETLELLARLARWTVIIVGTLIALDQVDFDITGFVAGLGLAGFTIGFALQDIARNFVAGILLLVRQPFDVGDAIEVGDYAGTVLGINTRDTVLKTWDGETVILPNIEVFINPLLNYSNLPTRRRTVRIGLGYEQDASRAIDTFLEAMSGVEGVLADPAPTVLATELGDSALALDARFWINQETHDLFAVHSDVVRRIKSVAEEQEIDLPYPIQTVRLAGDWPPSKSNEA